MSRIRGWTEEQRERKRAADRAYRLKNLDKIKAQRAANREHRAAIKRAWYLKNHEAQLAYAKDYYWENREEIRQREKAAYDADPEKHRAYQQQWRKNNPEKHRAIWTRRDPVKHRAAVKKWQKANPHKVLEISLRRRPHLNATRRERRKKFPELVRAIEKTWRAKNPEKMLLSLRRYHKKHPEKNKIWKAKRRARELNAPVNNLTDAQWEEILLVFKHRCAYCPATCKACKNKTHRLTQDHVLPLSKLGNHSVSNIVPACKSCNSRKHDGPPLVPVQPLLFTIA